MLKNRKQSPFLAPLLATACGITTQAWFPIPWPILILGITLGITLALLTLYKQLHHTILTASLCIFFGSVGALTLCMQKIYTTTQQTIILNQPIDIQATVTDKEVWGARQQSDVLRIAVTSIQFRSTHQKTPVSFDIFCYLPYHARFDIGDTIIIKDIVIKSPNMPTRSGNPGYEDYLAKENVLCSLFLHSAGQCQLIERPSFSIARWLWNIRHKSYFALKKKLSSKTFRYVGLIFFGNKQQPDITELRSTFNLWGLAHFLARAGLHIVFFIFIWTSFFSLFPIPIFAKRFLLILLCFIYNLLSWSSIPFTRALYAFLCIKCGELMYQQTYYLHILSLICLTILLFNPLQLFFLDFQLSFGLTFALIFLAHLNHSNKNTQRR